MAWPALGVGGGGRACAAAQPATGGGSRRSLRRWFMWLEQEDQRLKKQHGRWINIQQSRLLETFVDQVDKALRTRQFSRPTCQPPNLLGPSCHGEESFFLRNKEALPSVRGYSWWVPAVRGRNHFLCIIRRHLLACGHGPCGSLLSASPRTSLFRWLSFVDHVDHAAPRAPTRWMTARPRKGTTQSRRSHNSGCPCVDVLRSGCPCTQTCA
jgi:hypothetical protein